MLTILMFSGQWLRLRLLGTINIYIYSDYAN